MGDFILNKIYHQIADFEEEGSFARKIRLERIEIFKDLIYNLPKPLKILDIGGTEIFWEIMGFVDNDNYKITVLNLDKVETKYNNITSLKGDGRDISNFNNNEFDIVFSNSVIEHLGKYEDQKKMADEIKRLGKIYFLQTPSFYSPIEPHFFFPFFQLLPINTRIFLLRNFNLGYLKKAPEKDKAKQIIKSIRLLKKHELESLFPGSIIINEKLLGFTISFIIYK